MNSQNKKTFFATQFIFALASTTSRDRDRNTAEYLAAAEINDPQQAFTTGPHPMSIVNSQTPSSGKSGFYPQQRPPAADADDHVTRLQVASCTSELFLPAPWAIKMNPNSFAAYNSSHSCSRNCFCICIYDAIYLYLHR